MLEGFYTWRLFPKLIQTGCSLCSLQLQDIQDFKLVHPVQNIHAVIYVPKQFLIMTLLHRYYPLFPSSQGALPFLQGPCGTRTKNPWKDLRVQAERPPEQSSKASHLLIVFVSWGFLSRIIIQIYILYMHNHAHVYQLHWIVYCNNKHANTIQYIETLCDTMPQHRHHRIPMLASSHHDSHPMLEGEIPWSCRMHPSAARVDMVDNHVIIKCRKLQVSNSLFQGGPDTSFGYR